MSLETEFTDVQANLLRLTNNQTTLESLKALLMDNIAKEQLFMSQITDWAAKEQADLTTISTTLDGIVAAIVALNALITAFQNSPGTLSAADQAALDGIQTASKALVAKASAIIVSPPPPPPPPPPPGK
jgi:hypothetical protein